MRPVRPMLLSCVCWLLGGTTGVAAAALHVAPDATVPAVATSDAPATDATLDAAAQFDMLDGRRPKTLLSEGPHLAQERRRTARFELPTSEGAKEEERVAPTVQTLDVALDEALDAERSQPLSAVAESAAAVVEPSHDPANPSGQHGRALCHAATATKWCRHHHSPHHHAPHNHAPHTHHPHSPHYHTPHSHTCPYGRRLAISDSGSSQGSPTVDDSMHHSPPDGMPADLYELSAVHSKEDERVFSKALDAEWSQRLSAVAESAAAVVEPSHDPANPSGQHGRALCHGAATVLCRHHHSPHGHTPHSHAPTDRCGCGAVPANWKCIDTSLNSCNRCPTDYYRTGEKSA